MSKTFLSLIAPHTETLDSEQTIISLSLNDEPCEVYQLIRIIPTKVGAILVLRDNASGHYWVTGLCEPYNFQHVHRFGRLHARGFCVGIEVPPCLLNDVTSLTPQPSFKNFTDTPDEEGDAMAALRVMKKK